MKIKTPNLANEWLSANILDLIAAKLTNRIAICAMLSISQPTLLSLLTYHNYKQWQIDLLCRRLKLGFPDTRHQSERPKPR